MQNQIVKTFCEFVQIDSPTGSEREFSNYLRHRIEKLGILVMQDRRGNLFVRFRGGGNPFLLVAHIDTVEPGRGIVPVVKNGVVRSRSQTILGADNKAVVAMLFELIQWAKAKKIQCAFEVLFSVGEESGISGVDTFNLRRIRSQRALCFDIARPFGTMVLSSPYYLSQNIHILGKEADVSTADQGHSIIPTLTEFLNKIPSGISGDTFCNIGIIRGGNAANAILSDVQLQGEIRSFNEKDLKARAALIKSLLREIARKNRCGFSYDERLENYGYRFNLHDPFVKQISLIVQQITNHPIRYYRKYWGISDANNLNNRGIKTLNLGYGAMNPHTLAESISIKEMERVFRFLQLLLTSRLS